MAHTCPDCGVLCHCGGDIDDIDFGDTCKAAMRCTHCPPDGISDDEWDEYFEDDDEEVMP